MTKKRDTTHSSGQKKPRFVHEKAEITFPDRIKRILSGRGWKLSSQDRKKGIFVRRRDIITPVAGFRQEPGEWD